MDQQTFIPALYKKTKVVTIKRVIVIDSPKLGVCKYLGFGLGFVLHIARNLYAYVT